MGGILHDKGLDGEGLHTLGSGLVSWSCCAILFFMDRVLFWCSARTTEIGVQGLYWMQLELLLLLEYNSCAAPVSFDIYVTLLLLCTLLILALKAGPFVDDFGFPRRSHSLLETQESSQKPWSLFSQQIVLLRPSFLPFLGDSSLKRFCNRVR